MANETITTKDTERKALAKIEKIVKELGDNSYVGTAFEGCFEIARENIENDWACSMQDRVQSAERRAEEYSEKLYKMRNDRDVLMTKLDEANKRIDDLEAKLFSEQARNTNLEGMVNEYQNTVAEMTAEKQELVDEYETESHDMAEQLKAKDLEIVNLKAKLYDLLTK